MIRKIDGKGIIQNEWYCQLCSRISLKQTINLLIILILHNGQLLTKYIQKTKKIYCLIITKSAREGETSMNEIKWFKQYSKLILIELAGMKQVEWHFDALEYLIKINIQYSEVLSNVTERGYKKLRPREPMDVSFGRSIFYHFESFH